MTWMQKRGHHWLRATAVYDRYTHGRLDLWRNLALVFLVLFVIAMLMLHGLSPFVRWFVRSHPSFLRALRRVLSREKLDSIIEYVAVYSG